jgi:hypothetical protein
VSWSDAGWVGSGTVVGATLTVVTGDVARSTDALVNRVIWTD